MLNPSGDDRQEYVCALSENQTATDSTPSRGGTGAIEELARAGHLEEQLEEQTRPPDIPHELAWDDMLQQDQEHLQQAVQDYEELEALDEAALVMMQRQASEDETHRNPRSSKEGHCQAKGPRLHAAGPTLAIPQGMVAERCCTCRGCPIAGDAS